MESQEEPQRGALDINLAENDQKVEPDSAVVPKATSASLNKLKKRRRLFGKRSTEEGKEGPDVMYVTAEQIRKRHGVIVFRSASIQPIPNVLTAKRPSQRRLWLCALILATVACFVHMYFLLETFIMSPNAISITYERRQTLYMPRLHVCDQRTKMLDMNTVPENISSAYWYAMELGLGIVNDVDSVFFINDLNVTDIPVQYEKIRREYGSIGKAFRQFYADYGRKCAQIFHRCYYHFDQKVDCCQLFEPVFTLNGLCWVSKPNALKVSGIDSLANFRVRLIHNPVERRPKFLEEFRGFSLDDEAIWYEKFRIGLMPRLDQGVIWTRAWSVQAFQSMTVSMTQRQRVLMDNSNVCVSDAYEMKYFQEYSDSACAMQKIFFENSALLLNDSCELEIVELLKPDYKASKVCDIYQMLKLLQYTKLTPLPPVGRPVWDELVKSAAAENISLHEQMKDICDSPYTEENETTIRMKTENETVSRVCTLEALSANSASLGTLVQKQLSSVNFFNTNPKSLAGLAAHLQQEYNLTDEQLCLPLCNLTTHTLISDIKVKAMPSDIAVKQSELFLQYLTKEVEFVNEEPRQSLSEYFAMIGGNIGLWNGASIISLGHLLMLIFKAAGFEPFGL